MTTSPKEEIISFIRTSTKKILYIVTPNPEQLVYAQKDNHFAQILNDADIALPDGIGLVLAMRILGLSSVLCPMSYVLRRIPGVEFMEDLVAMAAEKGYPVALIGGRGGVAGEALGRLQGRYPSLHGWTIDPGDVDQGSLDNLGDVVDKIRETKTRIVFVGLGAPKQEFFIHRLMSYVLHPTSPMVFMAVGGSFDTIAGRVRRAPLLVRGLGLEWLWRLVREPWRWRRQLALLKFLWLVVCRKLA